MRRIIQVGAWLVASAWLVKLVSAARGLPTVPNLVSPEFDRGPGADAGTTVIVPARDEAADVEACLRSLLAQDQAGLGIVAVDDRSTDGTGAILDRMAAEHPERLRVIHVTELPEGWLGKTHAMATAAAMATTPFLLFTDADVQFRPDALRRSLALAEKLGSDHLILMPTTVVRRWDEEVVLGLLQIVGLWAIPLWRVSVRGSRAALGVGAFSLVRRSAYEAVGGYGAVRLAIVEDLAFGRRLKRMGFQQQVALGRGIVRLHWATGANGIVRVMTKNAFAAVNYSPVLVLGSCASLATMFLLPYAALFYAPLRAPAAVVVVANLLLYRLMRPFSGLRVAGSLLSPVAAAVLIYALGRSALVTLRGGGIVWRGTFYPLAELRQAPRL